MTVIARTSAAAPLKGNRFCAAPLLTSFMDDIKDARDSAVKSLQTASDHATVALDEGVAAASQAAKQTFAFTRDATQQIREDGQVRPLVVPERCPRFGEG